MLFNSFLFLFLPIVLVTFYTTRQWISVRFSIAILVVASFIFYGYWKPVYLILLLASIVINYALGQRLGRVSENNTQINLLMMMGIFLNLGVLGYFKYTDFLIANVNTFLGLSIQAQGIILPLAISFFTFQSLSQNS